MTIFPDRGEPITFDVSELFKPAFDHYRQEGYQAGLKRAVEARLLIQEARDTIHACNRQIITQEARLETRSLLDRALRIIDDE